MHTEEYLTDFIGGKISEKDQRRTGFPWSAGLVQRCRYETGMYYLTCAGTEITVTNKPCVVFQPKIK